jgi:hypothetical protein
MAKQAFIEYKPHKATVQKIEWSNSIISEFQAQDYTLTLRQLFYQLVSRDLIENNKASYDSLSETLTNARMAGMVDWDAIEDRGRVPRILKSTNSIHDALYKTAEYFRVNRQSWQDKYIEVWCEKDALSGILERVTQHYHVNLIINKGYGSTTSAYSAAQRIKKELEDGKEFCHILYFGDHDPSGLDMIRDVHDRLNMMQVTKGFEVKHIALTTSQVEYYNPPENNLKKDNFGKLTDPRGISYYKEFGNSSWEVDALSPEVLTDLLKVKIESVLDMSKFKEVCQIEEDWKKTLFELAEGYKG